MKNILISGGSGTVGSRLTALLKNKGYRVSWLSTSKRQQSDIFYWDVKKKIMDEQAILQTDVIIHLAGANVGEKRWTKDYKQEIVDSRVKSADLIFESLKKIPNKVKAVIGASAIGYYGDRSDDSCVEADQPGNDFLADTCLEWEAAVQQIASLGIRTVSLRTGIVLSPHGGALQPLKKSVKLGVSPVFGTGKQFYSWIHLDDLCGMYVFAMENDNMQGIYNAVAPHPQRYRDLLKQLAQTCHRPFIPVPVPLSLLKALKGEFAGTLAASTRCSADKILNEGFEFKFDNLAAALQNLIK